MIDFLELRQKCEDWLRTGQGLLVERALSEVGFVNVPRTHRLPLSQLARRANLAKMGLRFLSPIVNAGRFGYQSDVSAQEWAEYGMLLFQIGSVSEGLAILERSDVNCLPQASLFRSFCLFSQWRYNEAKPLLENYVMSEGLTDYQRSIGKVNLVSALINLPEDSAATEILAGLELDFRVRKYDRLLANVLEMQAQLAIRSGDFTAGEKLLDEALKILGEDQTSDKLFLEKWRCILEALKTGDCAHLREFKIKALAARHWETVREVDFYLLKILQDKAIFLNLYFGTSHKAYKERLDSLGLFQLKSGECFNLGSGDQVYDLSSGRIGRDTIVNPGKKIHQLLTVLFSDFYRPHQHGALFSVLFPDEKFDIFSSPPRIHQLVFRTRRLFLDRELPLDILEDDGAYRFHLQPGLRILITNDLPLLGSNEIHISKLREDFGENIFSAQEASLRLGLPATSLNRILKQGLQNGSVIKLGSGPKTRYQIDFETGKFTRKAG